MNNQRFLAFLRLDMKLGPDFTMCLGLNLLTSNGLLGCLFFPIEPKFRTSPMNAPFSLSTDGVPAFGIVSDVLPIDYQHTLAENVQY